MIQVPLNGVAGSAVTKRPPASAQVRLHESPLSHAVHLWGNQRLPTVHALLNSAEGKSDQHVAASFCAPTASNMIVQ